jgi:hypothetical protein
MSAKSKNTETRRAKSTVERIKYFQEIVAPDKTPIPIFPHQLRSMGNPAPSSSVPLEMLNVSSSRMVKLPDRASSRIKLAKSDVGMGLWELPENIQVAFGIPGKEEQVIRTRPNKGGRAERREQKDIINASIPQWLPLGFHPIPTFPTSIEEARTSDNRRILLSANHIQIYGIDDRINIYPNTYPECCVCRIQVYTQDTAGGAWIFRKYGTGFMVGSRIMMSSGHMRPSKPYAGWMIKVIPAYYDGQSIFGASFLSYASNYVAYQSDTGNDFMVCRLYDSIGDVTGYFGAITYNDDWEDWDVWGMTGYPYDVGTNRPTFQGSISVIDDDDGDNIELPNGSDADTTQIESKADEASGASGSPMYSWFTDGGLYAIGAHHGRESDWDIWGGDTHSVASGGVGFVKLIKWAKSAWP